MKITSTIITPMPRPMPQGMFDPMPEVVATFEDGSTKTLFSFYPDEIQFHATEFIGSPNRKPWPCDTAGTWPTSDHETTACHCLMKLPIHTAVIIHKEGATQYVSASHGELIDRIGGYCREHWSSVSDDPPPPTSRDLIDAYFYDNADDSLEVTEERLELPEPYASGPDLLDQLESLFAALAAYKAGNGETFAVLCREYTDTSAVIAKASPHETAHPVQRHRTPHPRNA